MHNMAQLTNRPMRKSYQLTNSVEQQQPLQSATNVNIEPVGCYIGGTSLDGGLEYNFKLNRIETNSTLIRINGVNLKEVHLELTMMDGRTLKFHTNRRTPDRLFSMFHNAVPEAWFIGGISENNQDYKFGTSMITMNGTLFRINGVNLRDVFFELIMPDGRRFKYCLPYTSEMTNASRDQYNNSNINNATF